MSGARSLFVNAPVTPAAPTLPIVPAGSSLAAAMSQPRPGLNLQTPSLGLPLSSMMQMAQALKGGSTPTTSATSSDPNLIWNPNNPVGTDTLGGNTANQGSLLGNAAATYLPDLQPSQGLAPGMPGGGAVGMPTPGSPGMPGGVGPGMGGAPGPGMPGVGQPGAFDQIATWLRSFGGQGGGSGMGG